MYYSASTGGFYDDAIHGPRTLAIPDPNWQRPTTTIPDPAWTRPLKSVPDMDALAPFVIIDGEEVPDPNWTRPTIDVPDMDATPPLVDVPDIGAEHPLVEIENAATKIPADAVEITAAEHAALLAAQTNGQHIAGDTGGRPVAVDPPPPSSSDVTKGQIAALEAAVTPRRMREAVLGTDGGWLADVDTQIAALRAQL